MKKPDKCPNPIIKYSNKIYMFIRKTLTYLNLQISIQVDYTRLSEKTKDHTNHLKKSAK